MRTPTVPKVRAPGSPAALLLAPSCPVARAIWSALDEGGVAVVTLDSEDATAALAQLDALVAKTHSDSTNRFLVALGDTRSLTALIVARQRQLAGVALVDPPPLHLEGTNPAQAPLLLFNGEGLAPTVTKGATPPVWETRLPALDEGWQEMPSAQIHSLVEELVLWVRARSD
jgi:hypothetical protein